MSVDVNNRGRLSLVFSVTRKRLMAAAERH